MTLGIFCLASATQDIAIDAYTIGLIDPGQEGPANSVRLTTYRVGLLLAGAGPAPAPRPGKLDKNLRRGGAAGDAALRFGLHHAQGREVPGPEQEMSFWARWRDRPRVVSLIAFVGLYRVGDRAMGGNAEALLGRPGLRV